MFRDKSHLDIQLSLVGGGIIERNQAILESDKLTACIFESAKRRRHRKREEKDKKKKRRRSKPKRPASFHPPPMIKTEVVAFDVQLSYNENEIDAREKVLFLQSQQSMYHNVAS